MRMGFERDRLRVVVHHETIGASANECFVQYAQVTSSCYSVNKGDLVCLRGDHAEPDALAVLIHSQFRGTILSPAFPCLGGAGAIRRGDYRFAVYGALGSAESAHVCATDLMRFVDETPAEEHSIAAFVAAFHGPLIPTEAAFETALWEQLRGMHERDVTASPGVTTLAAATADEGSIDPDPGFVFRARDFFVVGLHPASSRWARRFGWATLVFNALTHSDALKRLGKYDRMQETILNRDYRLQGSANPSLPFSQQSQFSGRRIGADWRCPVKLR